MSNQDNTRATPELAGWVAPKRKIVMMYKLDAKGRIVDTIDVEYHTARWGNYRSLGYVTA
jgi:hypothetical protein